MAYAVPAGWFGSFLATIILASNCSGPNRYLTPSSTRERDRKIQLQANKLGDYTEQEKFQPQERQRLRYWTISWIVL